jgi:hypothetical protein
MKDSNQILVELRETLARIRDLQAAAEANRPLRFNRRMSQAEERENERRRDRLDAIDAERTKVNADAARLRKSYADAFAAERAPKPPAPSEALAALYKRRDEFIAHLEALRDVRSKHALSGAEGDEEAKSTLAKVGDELAAGVVELQNFDLAIEQAEARDIKERQTLLQRDADEQYRAGIAAAEELIAWAEQFDNLLSHVGAHFAKLPDLKRALAKSGAFIDTDKTNRIYISAAHDRAAKHAGLHRVFSIDASVAASSLSEAYRSLLKAAVRRPER